MPDLRLPIAIAGIISLIASAPAAAQIQPGRVYRGGEVISDAESGLRLTLPAGWSGRLSADGEWFDLSPDTGSGRIIVMADELTDAEARRQMASPIELAGRVVLRPEGPVREVASGHLTAPYSVAGMVPVHQATIDVRITATGLGVVFVLLSPPASAAAQQEVMREFAFSLGVAEQPVRAAAPAAGAGQGDEWQPYLRGKYLARFFTRTGYTESTELWLCSDGTFAYNSQGGGFGGGASGAARSAGGGRWSATGAGRDGALTLNWSSGERTTLALRYDYDLNRLYVNGERMLGGKNEHCQ